VKDRKAFLRALAKNEDDTQTRMVYADWLDDHGEHEEADRQRKWPAAKAWLVRFCEEHNPAAEEVDEEIDEDDYGECPISYENLIDLGREALEEPGKEGFEFNCWNNMGMCDALRAHSREFWKNWSIVTGIPLPPDVEEKTSFHCAC
jgi:uncharacterized protein (TIGR02996 family)